MPCATFPASRSPPARAGRSATTSICAGSPRARISTSMACATVASTRAIHSFFEAVEVLKGPASMLFGRGSTGGVINQVSKTPSLRQSAELSATVGTDEYYRATADVTQPLVGHRRDARRRDGPGPGAPPATWSTTRTFGIAPSLRLGIGTPTEIDAVGAAWAEEQRPAGLRLPAAHRERAPARSPVRSTRPAQQFLRLRG